MKIFLDTQAPTEYNTYQTNITESHKQKNRKQNMADTKIKPQHHPAGRSFRFPLSVRLFVPLCLSGQDLRSTLVETPLQIGLFFAKQSQCQNGQYKHKYGKNKGLCQRTTNNEQRTPFKTNPIKANVKRGNSSVVRKIAPYRTCRTRDCHPFDCSLDAARDIAQGRLPRNDGGL